MNQLNVTEIFNALLMGANIIEKGAVQSILQTSLGGAGLLLAIYTFIVPITRTFFSHRINEYKNNRKELIDTINDSTPGETLDNLDNLGTMRDKLIKQSKLPRWINKRIIWAFSGYILCSLLSIIITTLHYHGILDIILIIIFLISTLIFFWIGYNCLDYIIIFLNMDYKTIITEVENFQSPRLSDASLEQPKYIDILPRYEEMNKIVYYSFEDDRVGSMPVGWNVYRQMSGTIEVTDDFGAEDSKKSLKIYSPPDSCDMLFTKFKPLDNFSISFYIRQEIYGDERGAGIGLHFYYNNTQAIWFAIWKKRLTGYWEGSYKDIDKIELNTWYKIRLDISCEKSEYYCYINDELVRRGRFRNSVNYIDEIRTVDWFKQAERLGYIDEIIIID